MLCVCTCEGNSEEEKGEMQGRRDGTEREIWNQGFFSPLGKHRGKVLGWEGHLILTPCGVF